MPEPSTSLPLINLTVELFGLPRLRSGRRTVLLAVPPEASRQEIIRSLAEACSSLVGQSLREDVSDLQDGYVFNHNGATFLSGPPEAKLSFQAGDTLLLLSNQAGG